MYVDSCDDLTLVFQRLTNVPAHLVNMEEPVWTQCYHTLANALVAMLEHTVKKVDFLSFLRSFQL